MSRRTLLAAALVLAFTTGARAQLPESPPPHRYVLRAELDPQAHRIEGTERIEWRNTSDGPVRELHFHLYLNAFAHDRTVFMRESGGSLRGVSSRGTGGIELLELRTADGTDLLPRAHTDVVEDDATQMRVELPDSVASGETLRLYARFRAELPPLFARSGYVDELHIVGQWFPKLARLEPDGTWATFPYHGRGEFYADFASYDLTVVTPPDHVVAATGRRTEDRTEDGRRVRRFQARWVHDVAFVSWPHFRERRERVGPVEVRLVYPPGYEGAVERHARVTRAGLRRFGRLYGRYPYEELTVVVPPRGAEGGAGMEYPTLFLTWGPWFTVPGIRAGLHDDVTAHELAHQWFQGLIATHEVRWPMLDEGLANWASWDLLGALHGRDRSAAGGPWPSIDGFELLRWLALGEPPTPPPARPAHAFGGMAYARAVYGRVPVLLETVARTWGRDRLHRALGSYARHHRFAHPEPEDLYASFDEVYGAGFADRVLRPALERGAHAGARIGEITTETLAAGRRTRVVAERTGEVPIPTRVHLRGSRQPPSTLPRDRRSVTVLHRGSEAVAAEIDVGRRNLLDPSELDDARRPPAFEAPQHGLWARAMLGVQTLLGWLGP